MTGRDFEVATTLAEALERVAEGFRALLSGGDLGAAITHWLEALPVVGVFLILFWFCRYILQITLIRDDTHKSARNGIALGMALIGLVSLYGMIVALFAGSFLVVLVVVFVVYGALIAISRMRTMARKAYADENRAHTAEAKTRMDTRRMIQDEKIDNRRLKKELKDVDQAENIATRVKYIEGDVESLFNDIRLALSLISSMENQGKSSELYRERISKKLAAAIADFEHEKTYLHKVRNLMREELKSYAMGFKIEEQESKTLNNFRALVRNQVKGIKAEHFKKEEQAISTYIAEARTLEKRKVDLEKDAGQRVTDGEARLQNMLSEKHALVAALAVPNNSAELLTMFSRFSDEFKAVELVIEGAESDFEVISKLIVKLQHLEQERMRIVNSLRAEVEAGMAATV